MTDEASGGSVDVSVLVTDYGFFQKAFELQFNHFMGIFYLWTGLIGAPVTAGLLIADASDPKKSLRLAILCFGIVVLGWFLSLKMFDIRRSQLRYAGRLNHLRQALYTCRKIEERYGLEPYGAGADLMKEALSDFGMSMATVMAGCHGALAAAGTWLVLGPIFPPRVGGLLAILVGALVWWTTRRKYFGFFPR